MPSHRPIRVAVIGGGCAALTAAFELTRPEHRGRYQVTVYQQGWRLGGKGASGRGVADRIEEHGLHLWMGFYENAFRLMRECYAELGRDPATCPIADWQDAFAGFFIGAMEKTSNGAWACWRAALPTAPGLPGDAQESTPRWTVADYMIRAAALLRTLLSTLTTGLGRGEASGSGPATHRQAEPGPSGMDGIGALIRLAQLGTLAGLIQGVELLGTVVGGVSPEGERLLLPVVDAIASSARTQLQAVISCDDESRRLWTIMDLTLATMRGILRHNLMTHPRGFEVIDDYDCREWLLLNGASQQSVASGYLRSLYDLGFAYEDGDPERPRLAAGQALRSMLRAFFTYRGAFFWKMQAGMGDIVFAPLYEVLRRRGVRFIDAPRRHPGVRGSPLGSRARREARGGRSILPRARSRGLPPRLGPPLRARAQRHAAVREGPDRGRRRSNRMASSPRANRSWPHGSLTSTAR
jgi:uncharacterized protein with NAD-binding domain and iron-sulfur cluster